LAKNKTHVIKEIHVPVATANVRFWALSIAIVGFLLYFNTIGNDYALDDNNSIIQNNYVQEGFSGIPKLMTIDYWYFAGMNLGYYRPLSLITFAIEHQLFGNNPHVSHFDNALLYGLTGFLLFLFLIQLFPKKHIGFSFLICLLFMAHPIHTEVVANIKSRDEILSFLNVIAMCYFAFRHIKTNKIRDLIWSLVFAYLGLLSKETAILGVLLLALFHYYKGKSMSDIFKRILPYAGVVILFFIQKQYFLRDTAKNLPKDLTNYPYLASAVRLPSTFHIFWLYIQKILIPWPLCYDYSYNQIPASQWTDPGAWLGVLAFVALAYFTFRELGSKTIWGLGLGIFFISIAPAIGFTLLRGGIMAERFAYAPCLGFAILLVYAVSKISVKASDIAIPIAQWLKNNLVLTSISILIFCSYGFETISRNPDWKDNLTLFGTDIKKASNSSEANFLFGNELIANAAKEKDSAKRKADFTLGMAALQKTVSITPDFGEAYNQMGFAYQEVYPNTDSAFKYYKKAIGISEYAIANVNLGTLYQKMGRLSLASYYYNQAVKINPSFTAAIQYADALKKATGLDVKEFPGEDKTDPQFMRRVKLNNQPDNSNQTQLFKMNFDAGVALIQNGRFSEAAKYFEKAEMVEPNNTENLLDLANSLGMARNYKKAISTFEKILKITPGDTVIMNNLAQTYRITGNTAKSNALLAKVKKARK